MSAISVCFLSGLKKYLQFFSSSITKMGNILSMESRLLIFYLNSSKEERKPSKIDLTKIYKLEQFAGF